MRVVISAWEYLSRLAFCEQVIIHQNARLMDEYTKVAVYVAEKLYKKVRGEEIMPQDLGLVLSSCTGPVESIGKYHAILKQKGYIGVNPSKFPNIMPAAVLLRIAVEIGAKGPCMPLLSKEQNRHILIYSTEQILLGRCRAMMLINVTKQNNVLGCFVEDEDLCINRGLKAKIIINEKDDNNEISTDFP